MSGEPTPVTSCWNGMVAMNAEPFYDSSRLAFRGIPDSLAKSHVEGSECCLIHTDNPLSREQGVWLNPKVLVGYNSHAYEVVNRDTLSWMSSFLIARGLWQNRLLRWLSSSWFRELTIRRRVDRWMDEYPGSHEVGSLCLIDEMQVLIANGWAHV